MLEVFKIDGEDVGSIKDLVSLKFEDLFDALGTFELWCPITEFNISILEVDNIINFVDGCAGIINYIKKERQEDGAKLLHIKGRMLDGLFDSRIIWGLYRGNGYPEDIVAEIVDEQCINASDLDRNISLLEIAEYDVVSSSTIRLQSTGDDLSSKLLTLAQAYKFGYDVRVDYASTPIKFIFRILHGVDRSSSQIIENDIVFSLANGSIASSEYIKNVQSVKNTALIAGAGEAENRIYAILALAEGLQSYQRKELFVDARDIKTVDENGQAYTNEEYEALLIERGRQKLAEYGEALTFTVNLTDIPSYVYGDDYSKGDKITIVDEELGITSDVIVKGLRYEIDGERNTFTKKLILGSLQPKPIEVITRAVSSNVLHGVNANDVQAKYSADSVNWHNDFAVGDVYIKFSIDGGAVWSSSIKFVGSDGADGEDGADGTSVRNLGTWNSSTQYVNNASYIDLVTINGSSYICKLTNTNQQPPNATYWDLIASKGDPGAAGVDGQDGVDGADSTVYFAITSSNGNTYASYPAGCSYSIIDSGNQTQSSGNSFPALGTVHTTNYSVYRFFQMLTGTGTNALTWIRNYYNGTWSVWFPVAYSSGFTLSGVLEFPSNWYSGQANPHAADLNNSDIIGLNGMYWADGATGKGEGLNFVNADGGYWGFYVHEDGRVMAETTPLVNLKAATDLNDVTSGFFTFSSTTTNRPKNGTTLVTDGGCGIAFTDGTAVIQIAVVNTCDLTSTGNDDYIYIRVKRSGGTWGFWRSFSTSARQTS